MKILYTNTDGGHRSVLEPESGRRENLSQKGAERTSFLGLTDGGRCAFYSKVRYSLREDMARKLQYRFYLKDLISGKTEELFTNWDRSAFQVNTAIPMRDGRFFIIASRTYEENFACIASRDGSRVQELWTTSGYPYGFAEAPQGGMFACHMALDDPEFNPGENVYSINTVSMDGTRRLVYGGAGKLCFGPVWSPDGKWLAFQVYTTAEDPGHHFGDVMICREDGSEARQLGPEKSHYGATAYGLRDFRAGGTNWVQWTPEGKVLTSRMLPGSHPDCRFDASQANHEELVYDPSAGKGGCGFTEIDPVTGEETVLTPAVEGQWDFRAVFSPDGGKMLFTRCRFGEAAGLYLMDRKTGDIRFLTDGENHHGADHGAFLDMPE